VTIIFNKVYHDDELMMVMMMSH